MNPVIAAVARRAEFLSDIRALDVSEGTTTREFELVGNFVFYSAVLGDEVRVPEGFRFDGESIPDWLHGLVPPFGQSKRGACAHDYLYQQGGYWRVGVLNPLGLEFIRVTRATADAVYRELTLIKGLPPWRSAMRYTVLRLVGWAAWRKHRRAKI